MRLSGFLYLAALVSANNMSWTGTFENFDFDALLAESDSPIAKELLSLSPLNSEEVKIDSRGYFDTEAQRAENRKRKLKSILEVVMFLQADRSAFALEKYLQYGCYCFPQRDAQLFVGRGDPVDEVDKVCKAFQTCYRCVGIDYGQEDCINSLGYEFEGKENKKTGERTLQCKDAKRSEESKCSNAQCECDKALAEGLAQMEIMWNPNNSAMYGGFMMETSCKRVERSVTERDSVDVRCCGYYPKRSPYAFMSKNKGQRNCCGEKTYDPNVLECCPGDKLQSLGTCIY